MTTTVYILLGAGVVVYLLLLAWLMRDRPITEMDRRLSAVDEELDQRRRRDAQERAAADQLRSQHNVTALPQREPGEVVPFPSTTDRSAS